MNRALWKTRASVEKAKIVEKVPQEALTTL